MTFPKHFLNTAVHPSGCIDLSPWQLSGACQHNAKGGHAILQDAAAAFCAKHGLPDEVVGPLAAHIADNLARAMLSPDPTPPASDIGDAAEHGDAAAAGGHQPEPPSRCDSLDFGSDGGGAGADAGMGDMGGSSTFGSECDGCVPHAPLPEAAARPAEGRTYTAPPSPTKQPARGGGGQELPFGGDAEGPVEHVADVAQAEEGALCCSLRVHDEPLEPAFGRQSSDPAAPAGHASHYVLNTFVSGHGGGMCQMRASCRAAVGQRRRPGGSDARHARRRLQPPVQPRPDARAAPGGGAPPAVRLASTIFLELRVLIHADKWTDQRGDVREGSGCKP